MASLNRVMILGRLGADPELRYTQNQTAVATLSVATTEFWTKDGQRQEQTEWHRVIVWNRQAENCCKYLSKGRSVFVEGKVQTRSWEDKGGQKRYTTEIIANNIQFVGYEGNNGASPGGKDATNREGDSSTTSRFPQADASPPASASASASAVNFDDIPF